MDLNYLIDLIIDLGIRYGYLIIFLAAIGEGMGLPIPDGIILAVSSYFIFNDQMSILGLISYFLLGSIVGNLIAYSIGRWSKDWLEKVDFFNRAESNRMNKVNKLFARYGAWALLITQVFSRVIRVPVIYAAGIQEMNIVKYSVLCLLGNLIWGLLWIFIGIYISSNLEVLQKLIRGYGKFQVLILISLIAIFYILYRRVEID
ncbi:DedA family protein [Sporohalobacter salinus]|uniref:DedA family protein n=1 Tax=Sporohalobacter salinus TaxID=1494606 RepID=UPI00195F7C61|nr:DedA family protein [Sporohalobacter salinus]MBM7624433.1 membrane protein DedA with SNARE-associated domain [Sporohalobacter salinus]